MMPRIPAHRVRKNDIVLIECYLTRWRKKANTNDKTRGNVWMTWGVSFELLRVAQLFMGPDETLDLPEEINVEI